MILWDILVNRSDLCTCCPCYSMQQEGLDHPLDVTGGAHSCDGKEKCRWVVRKGWVPSLYSKLPLMRPTMVTIGAGRIRVLQTLVRWVWDSRMGGQGGLLVFNSQPLEWVEGECFSLFLWCSTTSQVRMAVGGAEASVSPSDARPTRWGSFWPSDVRPLGRWGH